MSDTVTTGTGTPSVQERAGEAASTARHHAGEVADTARTQAAAIAGDAKDQARAVAADARSQARQLVDDSRRQIRDQAAEQSHRAATSLRDLGDQLQRMASGEPAGQGPAVDLARQAADGVQRLAETLEQRRPEELLDDLKRFARQRPGVFVLGALGAGFLAGRVLRAADTSGIGEAVKSGAGIGQGDDATAGAVSGPGTLGALQSGTIADPLTADPLSTGLGGSTPADLSDPAPTSVQSTPQWAGDTGVER
jgi:hypothetical protein